MATFQWISGVLVNLDQVLKVEQLTNGRARVTYVNGEQEIFERFYGLSNKIIPANPGFELLTWSKEDGLTRSDVIAWKIRIGDQDVDHVAVTMDDESNRIEHSTKVAVLQPSGMVRAPQEKTFKNVDEWVEW